MKKVIYVIAIVAICFYRCGQTTNNEISEPKLLLELCLDSLINEVPNFMDNDITMEDFATSVANELLKFRGDTLKFLSELIFTFDEAEKEYNSDMYTVKFKFVTAFRKYDVRINIISLVDKTIAIKLMKSNKYYISGIFKGFSIYGYPRLIEFGDGGRNEIRLGTLIIENLTIEPLN